MHTINKYQIKKFIFLITLDNGLANNSAVEILKMQSNPMFYGIVFMFVVCAIS